MLYCFLEMAHNRFDYFSIWAIFYPFSSLTTQKNQNLEKMKKTPGDIIILQKCNKNHDHIPHRS